MKEHMFHESKLIISRFFIKIDCYFLWNSKWREHVYGRYGPRGMADMDEEGPTFLFRKISNYLNYKKSECLLLTRSPASNYGKILVLFFFKISASRKFLSLSMDFSLIKIPKAVLHQLNLF